MQKEPVPKILCAPMTDNPRHFMAVMQGPDGTCYAGGHFNLEMFLPADYPNRDNMFADDIASMAFEDRAKPLGEDEITTQREFEQAFRDKVAARSSARKRRPCLRS